MRVIWVFPFFLVAVLAIPLASLDRYFFKQNQRFGLSCVLPNWSLCPQVETPHDTEYPEILDQPFSYLSQGKQSFVFLAQDGKWVIKLFRLPRYVKIGNLKGSKSSLTFLQTMLESFRTSSEFLQEETQVVYAHLRPTTTLQKKIELIDSYQHPHLVDLDQLPFVIQRVGQDYFTELKGMDDHQKKRLIRSTVDLFSGLYEKGFIDRDPIFDKNFGMANAAPFIMDIGQLEPLQEGMTREQYLLEMTNSLDIYLRENAPHLYTFYRNLLH